MRMQLALNLFPEPEPKLADKPKMRTSSLSWRAIGDSENDEMLDILLDSPMESDGLTLCLDRSPDLFAVPKRFFDSYKCYGFFQEERLVGFVMVGHKILYVNGIPRQIGYLSNLYIRKEARKRGWYYRVSEPLFKETLQDLKFGFATTLRGNKNTEPMIGRRISKFPFIPFSASIGINRIFNILVLLPKKPIKGYTIRRATLQDVPEIVRLLDGEYRNRLFGPVMTPEELLKTIEARPGFTIEDYYLAERDDRIVGVCSAWDLRRIRKLRVMAYHGRFAWVRFFYRMLTPVFRLPSLPKPGDYFRELVINDYAVEGRNPQILRALLIHIYSLARRKGYNLVQIGSYEGDPLMEATRGFFYQPLDSHILAGMAEPDLIEKEKIDCSKIFLDIALT